jgi:hypothetical protein
MKRFFTMEFADKPTLPDEIAAELNYQGGSVHRLHGPSPRTGI